MLFQSKSKVLELRRLQTADLRTVSYSTVQQRHSNCTPIRARRTCLLLRRSLHCPQLPTTKAKLGAISLFVLPRQIGHCFVSNPPEAGGWGMPPGKAPPGMLAAWGNKELIFSKTRITSSSFWYLKIFIGFFVHSAMAAMTEGFVMDVASSLSDITCRQ